MICAQPSGFDARSFPGTALAFFSNFISLRRSARWRRSKSLGALLLSAYVVALISLLCSLSVCPERVVRLMVVLVLESTFVPLFRSCLHVENLKHDDQRGNPVCGLPESAGFNCRYKATDENP